MDRRRVPEPGLVEACHSERAPVGRLPSVVCAAILLVVASVHAGAAASLQCIEASRYRNLVTIFGGDQAALATYLGFSREQRPPLDACRAAIVTGTLEAGDAGKLTDWWVDSRSWLAVLYVSVDGSNLDEEMRLATIIRTAWLKTWVARRPALSYEPDFAGRSVPLPPSTTNAWPVPQGDVYPLEGGLRDYYRGRDVALRVPGEANSCGAGCALLYAAGVHRRLTAQLAEGAAAPPAGSADRESVRLRAAAAFELEQGRAPRADDPALANAPVVDAMSQAAPAIVRVVREQCEPEFSAAEAQQRQIAVQVEEWAARDFKSVNAATLVPRVETIRKTNARLQQCIVGAYDKQRLAAFQRYCGTDCGKDRLRAMFDRLARDALDRVRAPASAAR